VKRSLTSSPLLVASLLVMADIALASTNQWIPSELRNSEGFLRNEVEFMIRSYHPSRMIILLSDPRTAKIEAVAGSKHGKLLSRTDAFHEASRFRFDPGAVFESFTLEEVGAAGIRNVSKVSAMDLLHLFGAVAEGGVMRPVGRSIIPQDQVQARRNNLLELVQGKKDPILLARVDGMRVAGAAGHGGKNPVTACFAGYFPADHPRHICVVVVEGAGVILKYQRGALLAAPVFSFIAGKIRRHENP
jgi:hypothetical protein